MMALDDVIKTTTDGERR